MMIDVTRDHNIERFRACIDLVAGRAPKSFKDSVQQRVASFNERGRAASPTTGRHFRAS